MKILMVADVQGWAWDRNVTAIQKHLPQYQIVKVFEQQARKIGDQFDHVHYFSWLASRKCAADVTAAVCSHNFELRENQQNIWATCFPKYMALTTNSSILYEKVRSHNDHVFMAANGVDEEMFQPVSKERGKTFKVGWIGQVPKTGLDIKGYNDLFVPLMEELKDEDIEFVTNVRNYTNKLKHSDMPKYYHSVDCQICTSFREGTPNPMFEAAACGKALISTRVGAISDFIDHGVNGFIINAYNSMAEARGRIAAFKKHILTLKNDRDLCEQMGRKGREIIERDWTWKKRARQWIPLFEYVREVKGL